MEFYKLKYFYNAQVLKGAIDFKSEPWPKVSEAAKDCVRRLLDMDVTRRATAEQILKVGNTHSLNKRGYSSTFKPSPHDRTTRSAQLTARI